MPAVNKDEALELLTKEIQEKIGIEDLLEVYNEVFPDNLYTGKDSGPRIQQLVDHINGGLEIGEVMELWRLIFPKYRNVWFDDVAERIHYSEEAETVSSE